MRFLLFSVFRVEQTSNAVFLLGNALFFFSNGEKRYNLPCVSQQSFSIKRFYSKKLNSNRVGKKILLFEEGLKESKQQ